MSAVPTMQAESHWDKHALNWQHFGSPLRPAPEDIGWFEQRLGEVDIRCRQAALLGVTPELAHKR